MNKEIVRVLDISSSIMVHMITGAAGGMGRNIAESLGADEPVLLADLDEEAFGRCRSGVIERSGMSGVERWVSARLVLSMWRLQRYSSSSPATGLTAARLCPEVG